MSIPATSRWTCIAWSLIRGVEEHDESEDDDNDWNDNLQYSDESDDYEPPDDGGL